MPKETVKKIIKKYGTNCPFEIAKQKGILIVYEAFGGALGYYNCYKRIQFIHINNDIVETLQKFVCAHELGHAILHPSANTPFMRNNTLFSIDQIEIEANRFAVELLIPDKSIYELGNTNLTIKDAAVMYGVPKEVSHLKKL